MVEGATPLSNVQNVCAPPAVLLRHGHEPHWAAPQQQASTSSEAARERSAVARIVLAFVNSPFLLLLTATCG